MFGTISESEMRRRTENVGLSVQSVRLEGGDVTRAFMRDAGEYARGCNETTCVPLRICSGESSSRCPNR